MKALYQIIAFIITFILFSLPVFSSETSDVIKEGRWDMRMIDEVQIWKKLLTCYSYAEHQKYWPERKNALNEIVTKFPNSQWADDAELILACGKFEFEGKQGMFENIKNTEDAYSLGYFANADEAINDLREIINKYPNEKTILKSIWFAGMGCQFDDVWLYNQGSLVSLNTDGSVNTRKPFDRSGTIPQLKKEVLAYFEYLEKYPVYTKDVARIYIAEIYGHQKKYKENAEELEKIIVDTNQITKILRADSIAATDINGYWIRDISRPQYRAYSSLISYYEKFVSTEKAIAFVDSIAPIINHGPNYGMMRQIGEFYDKHGFQSKAKPQYQQTLNRINEYIVNDRERSKHLEYLKVPTTDEERSPILTRIAEELKEKIK